MTILRQNPHEDAPFRTQKFQPSLKTPGLSRAGGGGKLRKGSELCRVSRWPLLLLWSGSRGALGGVPPRPPPKRASDLHAAARWSWDKYTDPSEAPSQTKHTAGPAGAFPEDPEGCSPIRGPWREIWLKSYLNTHVPLQRRGGSTPNGNPKHPNANPNATQRAPGGAAHSGPVI